MGELYATLLVRLVLPLATLIAALIHFSAFGLAYLAAFAALMHRPSYSLRKHYPAPALAVLASFSLGLLVVQVTIASLIAAKSLQPSDGGLWPHLDDVGIARFDRSVWDGLRAVLGPALVTAVSLLCLLAEECRSRRSFVYFMLHRAGAPLADRPRSVHLRLRQTRSLIESALVTVADAPPRQHATVPGIGNAIATRERRGRGSRHSIFPWTGGPLTSASTGVDGSRGGAGGKSAASSSTTLSLDLPAPDDGRPGYGGAGGSRPSALGTDGDAGFEGTDGDAYDDYSQGSYFPDNSDDGVASEMPSRLTRFMAGTGGVFWTAVGLAATGTAVSSVANSFFTAVLFFVVLSWGFGWEGVRPAVEPGRVLRGLAALRVALLLYIFALVSFQLDWLNDARQSPIVVLLGIRRLSTAGQPQGWTHMMALGGALFCYVVSGLWSKAVRGAYVTRTRWAEALVAEADTVAASLSRPSSFLSAGLSADGLLGGGGAGSSRGGDEGSGGGGGGGSSLSVPESPVASSRVVGKAWATTGAAAPSSGSVGGSMSSPSPGGSTTPAGVAPRATSAPMGAGSKPPLPPGSSRSRSAPEWDMEASEVRPPPVHMSPPTVTRGAPPWKPPLGHRRLGSVSARLSPAGTSGGSGAASGRSGGSGWTPPILGLSGLTGSGRGMTGEDLTSSRRLGSALTASTRFGLSAKEFLLLRSLLHLASVALMVWVLVLPGYLTLPLLVLAFLYLAFKRCRNSRVLDYAVYYAMALQLVHAVYVATLEAWGLPESQTADALGLRILSAPVVPAVIQVATITLIALSIYLKEYLKTVRVWEPQRGGGRALMGNVTEQELLEMMLSHREYSAVAKGAFSPFKVILDQFALAALYVAGAAAASALNAVFIVALTAICVTQVVPVVYKRRLIAAVWVSIFVYSMGFMAATSAVCRIGRGDTFDCARVGVTVGLTAAPTLPVLAYTALVVCASIQVHFTWPWRSDTDEATVRVELSSVFWSFLREYFLYVAYAALLLYPLVSPANFLSYGYLVFLLMCFLVEILFGFATSRRVLGRLWFAVVLFACLGLVARYLVRFDDIRVRISRLQLIFGVGAGMSGFVLTLGDAAILIIISLQGRLFLQSAQLAANATELPSVSPMRPPLSSSSNALPQSSSLPAPLVVSAGPAASPGRGPRSSPVRPSPDAATTAAPSPPLPRPVVSLSGSGGSGDGSSKDMWSADKAGSPGGGSASLADPPHVGGRVKGSVESPGLVRVDSDVSSAKDPDAVELPDVSTRAKLLDAKRFLLRVRNSLPVVQTRDAIKWLYVRVRKALQQLLFPYSSILPASAVVAAAIWLDGISCFGGIYLVLGCLVVCLDNRPAINRRADAVIPLALRVLSPTLLLLSFSFMTLQYLYLVLNIQGGALIETLQNGDWGPMVIWIGLQFERDANADKLFLPITQHAMLAHCLVFVTAFLQRATLRWAAASFSNAEGDREADGVSGQLARNTSGVLEGGEQVRAGLLSARPISDVMTGLVLDNAKGKARMPSSSSSSSGAVGGDGSGRGVGGSCFGPAPEAYISPAGGPGHSADRVRDASGSGGSRPLDPSPSRHSSVPYHPVDPLSSRNEGMAGSRVHFSSSSPRPLGPGSPGTLASGVSHDAASGGVPAGSFRAYGEAADGDVPDLGPPSPYLAPSTVRRTNRFVHWCGRSLLKVGRRLGEVLGLLQPFWASWGFDLTYVVLVVGAAVSRTVFSLLHILFVLAVCLVPRRTVSRMWVVCTLFLVALVLLQYALSLGLPPLVSWSWDLRDEMPSAWQAWLYIDESNDTRKRRTDITIAFIAVICAGTTLNAIPPRVSLRRCGNCDACTSVSGTAGWLRRLFGLGRSRSEPPCPPSDTSSVGKEEAGAAEVGGLSGSGRVSSLEAVAISGVNSSAATLMGVHPPDPDEHTSKCFSFRGGADGREDSPLNRCFAFASSGDGSPSQPQPAEVDFTQRPLTFANAVKLGWMRFAGSAVQLYLFAVAAVDPSVFSAVLLGLAFYFFFQFTNVATRRARFVIVRLYVLSVILAVVAYQAPFAPPTREDGSPSPWPRIFGLYKLSGMSSGKDPAAAAALLGLFVSLWILSQMQGRIYESKNFRFVVRNMKEDEVLRFRRAIHDHQDRMTEQMLASNELERNKAARAARLQRLQALKHTTRSVDAFFDVCVVQEAELAAKDEAAAALPELQFAPRLSFSAALAAAAADESKLPRFSRTPGQTPMPSSSRLPGLRFRRPDGTFATPGAGGGGGLVSLPSQHDRAGAGGGEASGLRRAHGVQGAGGGSSSASAAAFVADVAPGSKPVDTYPLRSDGVDGPTATSGGCYESLPSGLGHADGAAGAGAADPSPEGTQEDFPWWNRMLRAMSRGARWQSHLHHSLRHELRFFVTRYSAWPVYLSMLLAVTVTPTIMSVVYPLVLFLYLLVEQPRPPKSAWIALIFYVEAVITFKFVARKFVTPDVRFFVNDYSGKGEIFKNGLHIQAGGIFFDILVLASLLWHRRILYYRGLWDLTDAEERYLLRPKVTGRAVVTPSDAATVTDPTGLAPFDVVSAEEQLAAADAVIGLNAHRLESLGCFEDERPASDPGSSSATMMSGGVYENSWGVTEFPPSGGVAVVPGAAGPSSSRPRDARDDQDDSSLGDACFVSDAIELDAPGSSAERLSTDRESRVRVHSIDDMDAALAKNDVGGGITRPLSERASSFQRGISRGGPGDAPTTFSPEGPRDRFSGGPRSFSSVKSLPKLDVSGVTSGEVDDVGDHPSLSGSLRKRSASSSARGAGVSQPSIRLSSESHELSRRGSTLRSCRSMTLRTLDEEEEGRASALHRKRSVRHTFAGGVIGGLIGEDADVERPADVDDAYGLGGGVLRADEEDDQLSTVGSLRSRRSRRGTTPSGFPGLGRRRSSRMPTPSGAGKRRTPAPADEHVEDLIAGRLSAVPTRAEMLSDEQLDGEFLGAAPAGVGGGGRHRPPPALGGGSSPMALLGAAGQGVFSPIVLHYQRLLRPHTHKAVGDFYLAIFATDFMAFVFLIFGFSYMFSESDQFERVTTWWTTNFVETRQLVVVIIAFFALVLDRVIYLRRSMKAKLAVQYVSVLVYHYFLFLHVEFGQRQSLRYFYVLKCIYFFVSGLQIRSGFPLYTTGQWLLRNFSLKGLIAFHIYYNIPFLWLTRTLLDWAVLPTSLEIFQYFKFIDVYIYLYQNRAINASRGWFKRVLGQKRPIVPRIFQGGGLFLLCALLLFLPFFLFSLANPLFRDRQLIASTYSVDLLLPANNDSVALYSRSTTSAKELKGGKILAAGRPYALDIQERSREQVYSVFFDAPSASRWTPPPPTFDRLNASLQPFVLATAGSPLLDDGSPGSRSARPTLRFELTGADSEETYSADVAAPLTGAQVRAMGAAMTNLTSTALELPLNIDNPSPKAGTLSRYMTLVAASSRFRPASRRNSGVCLRFHSVLLDAGGAVAPGAVPTTGSSSSIQLARRALWWSVTDCVRNVAGVEDCVCNPPEADGSIGETGADAPFDGLTYILQISAVARIAVGGGTILTLYAVVLFSVAQLAKSWFSNKRLIIPVTDMPYTHHLFTLVSDIVYARQDGRLDMEEVLFNGLMDIYRDPHAMVRWTGERHLKPPTVWWEGENAVDTFPSYRETATEPYLKVKQD